MCPAALSLAPAQGSAQVMRLTFHGPDVFVIWLQAPGLAQAQPGQFVHLRVGDGYLRRPFSIYRVAGDQLALLVRAKGRGTRWLAGLAPGSRLDWLGPLGRPYSAPSGPGRVLLVGGGVGVAPLVHFAETHAAQAGLGLRALFGFRSADQAVNDAPLAAWGVDLTLYTEDGSQGRRGRVVDDLPTILRDFAPQRVLTCGPDGLMRAVAEAAAAAGVPCEVSLERPMGCGIGVCLLCVVPVRGEGEGPFYERVCCEGPVFDAERLAW
ncbi:MAG: dihydroorotate dehydrogenase electron transfer subunit [Candidatus Sericytochromatia bacterium]|nr:dihydroorotate dehydrogenase electron transfer subunit [Candidatus Sericytochromatia bacterium]